MEVCVYLEEIIGDKVSPRNSTYIITVLILLQ